MKEYKIFDQAELGMVIPVSNYTLEKQARALFHYWRRKLKADDPRKLWCLKSHPEGLEVLTQEERAARKAAKKNFQLVWPSSHG